MKPLPIETDAPSRAFAEDVLRGLRRDQKSIPSQYFYDERGSELFEQITKLDAYYPTRTEIGILKENIPDFAKGIDSKTTLIEFGSGSSTKTEILLNAISDLAGYVAIDVSPTALENAKQRLQQRYPDLPVITVEGSFFDSVTLPPEADQAPRLGFFPGSTIGNFEPEEAVTLLAHFRQQLGPNGRLIIGTDLEKDAETLERAYDDPEGVTARFNMNLLTRLNTELDGRFDLDHFNHRALYNRDKHRVEMHLVSKRDQRVAVAGHQFDMTEGETIHTENSHKYSVERFTALAEKAGWQEAETWTDADDLFAVHVLSQS